METVSALAFRKNFGKVLDKVAKEKQAIIVERMNQPLVVMEPYETYMAQQTDSSRKARILRASEKIEEWAKRNAPYLKGIKAVETIRKMRDSR